MAHLMLALDSKKAFGSAKDSRTLVRKIADYLYAGQFNGVTNMQLFTNDTSSFMSYAQGGATLSGGSGSISMTINGTAVAVTWTTSDINTAGLLAAAINANTSVNQLVEATNFACQLNLAAIPAGGKVIVAGVEFTAVAATTGLQINQFSTTSQPASLLLAINSHPSLKSKYFACGPNGGGAVVVAKRKNYTPKLSDTFAVPSGSVVVGHPTIAFLNVAVACLVPGVIGNCVTLTASGTGMSAALTTGGKLSSGTGGFTQFVRAQ